MRLDCEDELFYPIEQAEEKLKGVAAGMNIRTTITTGYSYTNTAVVTKKEAVSDEIVFKKQTKKEYKNVVREYMKKNPNAESHVRQQVEAGKNYIKNCGVDEVSRNDMTMNEYKAFIRKLMDNIPFDGSQANNKEMWSITEEGWEQMKNDPDYEAWILGYTIENRSVHFPFQASNLNIEKFGASIEEHHGQGIPINTESSKKPRKKEDTWWYKRQKRMKELMKAQQEEALKKARMQRRAANVYEMNIRTFSKSVLGEKTGLH